MWMTLADFAGRAQRAVPAAPGGINTKALRRIVQTGEPRQDSSLRRLALEASFTGRLGMVRSVDPAGRFVARRRWGRNHQAETLQKKDRALSGASPNELATFTLAILNVNVPARILQAAILELAIHVDAIVQNHMLILEDLVLMSVHRFTRAECRCEKFDLSRRRKQRRGSDVGLTGGERLDEATIHLTWMQATRIG